MLSVNLSRWNSRKIIMSKWKAIWLVALAVLVVATVLVPVAMGFKDSGNANERIFTKTVPSASGGIKGTIASPNEPIQRIVAMCYDNTKALYKGSFDSNGNFSFHNLPAGVYDLVVIYPTSCYEGLQLMRRGERSTLTKTDMIKVNHTVEKAEKFWRVKTIFRLEGTTGTGNECRAFVRMMKDNERKRWKFVYKLMIFKDVGPGWQVKKTREIYYHWVPQAQEAVYPKVSFSKDINRIRVSDYVKDIGKIYLIKAN